MRDFGYSMRARAMNEARAEVHEAFREMRNRNDGSDPRTQRWLDALRAFRTAAARVYPKSLKAVDDGTSRASDVDTADILDFLEADPMFFRSGYMKQKLLREIKKRDLDGHEVDRLQAVFLGVVRKNDHRREFLYYCRAAANVDDPQLRAQLKVLEDSGETHVSQRANWVLAGLNGKWLELRRAARGVQRQGGLYYRVPNPRIL